MSLFFGYHIASRLAYVIGVGVALRQQQDHQFFTRDHGVEAGYRKFRRIAWALMNNDAVSFFFLCLVTARGINPMSPLLFALGVVFVVIGISTKLWATRRLARGAFYWHNFFFPGVHVAPNPPGPYRFLKNPMYTAGYLHMYGWALMCGSWLGYLAAFFDQIAILVFYNQVERPHFERILDLTRDTPTVAETPRRPR